MIAFLCQLSIVLIKCGKVNLKMINELSSSISGYLIERIPEISFFLSSILMVFISDYIMGSYMLKSLKRMNFLSRTFFFLVYGLLILPAMTTFGAFLLRNIALYPLKQSIILVLIASFFLVGVFFSIKYNIKMKLKLK